MSHHSQKTDQNISCKTDDHIMIYDNLLSGEVYERLRKYATEFLDCDRDSAKLSEDEKKIIDHIDSNFLEYIGTGVSRHTFRWLDSPTDKAFVIKFSRSFNHTDSYYRRGIGQNRAERRLYNLLNTDEQRLKMVENNWIASVYLTGKSLSTERVGSVASDAWILMEYVEPLDSVFPDTNEKILRNLSHQFESLFLNSGISPDIGFENIGVRENFSSDSVNDLNPREDLSLIDFGLPNWYKSNLCSPPKKLSDSQFG